MADARAGFICRYGFLLFERSACKWPLRVSRRDFHFAPCKSEVCDQRIERDLWDCRLWPYICKVSGFGIKNMSLLSMTSAKDECL